MVLDVTTELMEMGGKTLFRFYFSYSHRSHYSHSCQSKKDERAERFENFASLCLYLLLGFSAYYIGDDPSEAAIISLMGVAILDVIRVDFAMKDDDNLPIISIASRLLHLGVGIGAFVLIAWGMGATEDFSFGTKLNGTLDSDNSKNLNVELPAAAKIMRDVAFISAAVKCVGIFYLSDYKNGKWSRTQLLRFSSENTLRQMSTLGLLISSSFVWAYPIVNIQNNNISERDAGENRRLGVSLFVLAVIARLVDSVVDSMIHSDSIDWFIQWWERPEDKEEKESIEKATWDNPRTWLVIASLATSLGLLVQVRNKEEFPDSYSDYNHKQTVMEISFGFLIVHLIVAALQMVGKFLESNIKGTLTYASLSRSPFVRVLVTTTILTTLTMLVAESGFAGKDSDMYGLLKNTHSTTPSSEKVYDTLVVSQTQWNAVGALAAYIVADLVGHVFL